jgi:NAD(P)-dependent dehydrogenase (short-subunit alcohol dehydrogenase family)
VTLDLESKTFVVTGSTSGLGLATAEQLARRGGRVIMIGRDDHRAGPALSRVREATAHPERIVLHRTDLASPRMVRNLAESLRTAMPIDVLVNNAGVLAETRKTSPEGLESTFATNYLAPVILTLALRSAMPTGSRVVNISSLAHRMGKIHFDDLQLEHRYDSFRAYAQSKLALLIFTRELASRIPAVELTINAVHPGILKTNLYAGSRPLARTLQLCSHLMTRPERGARTPVYVSTSPDVATTTGAYFVRCRAVAPAARARDPALAERLWHTTARHLEGLGLDVRLPPCRATRE